MFPLPLPHIRLVLTASRMATCSHGVVAKVKRCIMERDLYPRRWGLGPVASEKKKLKTDGKLDKFGRPNEATPATWTQKYTDLNPAPPAEGEDEKPAETAAATPKKADKAEAKAEPESAKADKEDKKRKSKHDGETAEEKAERKRAKKEKKEKRKSQSGGKDDDSD